MKFLSVLGLAVLAAVAVHACDDPALCNNLDCGSCGNACCKLMITVPGEDTQAVMTKLYDGFNGGPDGHYALQMTAEGTLGFADLSPYNKSIDFIGQAVHTTLAPNYYNDTINLSIAKTTDGKGSVIEAFSISQIAGAYCDDGQNYFNVMNVITSLDFDYYGGDAGFDGSCPQP
mmetsp:Transcript_17424/g.31795  ORF Transcript_17424/g.31795 Transcript_17424/m.31795 type:complete len:174 (+) Transcript_17424:34-555(+)